MNRTDICKNIIQSIKEYITNPDKLEAHRKMKLAEVCTSEFNNSLIAIINKTGWVNNHNTANSNTKNHTNLPIAAIPE